MKLFHAPLARTITVLAAVLLSVLILWLTRWYAVPFPFNSAMGAVARVRILRCVLDNYANMHGSYPDPNHWRELLLADDVGEHIFTDVWLQELQYDLIARAGSGAATPKVWSVGGNGIDERGDGDDIGWRDDGCHQTWISFPINSSYYWARHRNWSWWLAPIGSLGLLASALPRLRRYRTGIAAAALLVLAASGWCFDAGLWGLAVFPFNCLGYLIALPMLSLSLGILADARISRPIIRWRRSRLGLCTECAYDRTASSDRCPECGAS